VNANRSSEGLAGAQLDLEQGGFRRALERFQSRVTRQTLSRVLGWANVILGSLGGVVPGVEAIKEYKESFEQARHK
jgi:hypothetical protein